MITAKKLNSSPRSAILGDFQNQEYRFTIPKSRTRLAKKRGKREEDQRQLESVMRFRQSQLSLKKTIKNKGKIRDKCKYKNKKLNNN